MICTIIEEVTCSNNFFILLTIKYFPKFNNNNNSVCGKIDLLFVVQIYNFIVSPIEYTTNIGIDNKFKNKINTLHILLIIILHYPA